MKHCYLKRNLKFFAGCMCVWAMSAPITAQVLPDGMTRLTPEGLELGSVMSVANPLGPKEHAVRTENFLFFAGKDTEHGSELWYTDLTPEGTKLFMDIIPGSESSEPSGLKWVNGKLFFTAETAEYGRELWVSDGTVEGTKMVKDIYPGNIGSQPGNMVILGDKVLFTARDEESEMMPVVDPETPESWIWISDGTEEGTVRIASIPMRSYFEVMGDKAFFAGVDLEHNEELWITDGTPEGTMLLKDINNRPSDDGTFVTGPAGIGALRNINDKMVIFRAETVKEQVGQDYGSELWYSDGTPEGTKWLGFDFAKGETGGLPTAIEYAFPIAFGDTIYFRAKDGVHGCEPCFWDLTKPIEDGVNPRMIYDINHWGGNISLDSWGSNTDFFVYQGYLMIQANGGYYMPGDATQYASGYSLWLAPTATLDTCIYQRQFWGTDIAAGSLADNCSNFREVSGKLFFKAQDENNNSELWVIDGIENAPVKVVDLPDNGSPTGFYNINNNLYFGSTSTKALYKYDLGGTSAIEDPVTVAVKVTIYPNPATERIFITTHQDIKTVQIYDLSGAQVLETAADNIDVSALNGIYFVKVVLADGHQVVEKIVVK